ncbi:hypothetical protein Lbys_2079 [Leadbetterella byssophila DSM 17132]|uniref:DinB-like domain-containing protein n=1 Tax=Leadbetterella byssophila (strain DSM 17132 / JCM 16389 / KACC 11308 / NBRC 106382 / 4M15) TaxID=649349 RepID=E4RTQ1_LEAB4|nr:DinB family protein [Leadbetterella byssophila]ADQ17775.1 hypothetical protein Lbys_2079 [Leadbetterella byssophila DSM 17132]
MEYWMQGPLPGIPALVQPVAHVLKQLQKEVHECMVDFPENLLYERPFGRASVGFHLLHIGGVIDRMFTYAEGKMLNDRQFRELEEEKLHSKSLEELLRHLDDTIGSALGKLSEVDQSTLTETRYLGRKRIPVTLMGLLFHSAEHGMRHLGQLIVTVSALKQQKHPPIPE